MKKILALVCTFILILTSCSSDDNGGNNDNQGTFPLTVTINGVQKNFNSIFVDEHVYSDSEGSYTELTVIATINGDVSELIHFSVRKNSGTGAIGFESFAYTKNDVVYSPFAINEGVYYLDVQTNSNNKLKGTFSATVGNSETTTIIELTNGSFDISY